MNGGVLGGRVRQPGARNGIGANSWGNEVSGSDAGSKPVRHTDLANMLRRWIPQPTDGAARRALDGTDPGQIDQATGSPSGTVLSKA